MAAPVADICLATGNPWPPADTLMVWALQHVNARTLFLKAEVSHLRDHILDFWDMGALRTLWAYFHDDVPSLEQFMLHYYLEWHTGGGLWSCVNPSACLVWHVRSFWDNQLFH